MTWASLWPVFVGGAGATVAWGLASLVLAHLVGRTNVIDTMWPLGFLLVAVVGFAVAALDGVGDPVRQVLIIVLTGVWAFRLGIYVGVRSRGRGDDPRYVDLLERHGGGTAAAVRYVFVPQTMVLFLVSSTLSVSLAEPGPMGPLGWLGVAVWLLGLTFEAVGDRQLDRFRAQPGNRGTLIRSGLWRYTRHPNYFGDAAVWSGLWLLGADHWPGWPTVLAPALMVSLLVGGTGKRLLEQSMSARPGWPDYAADTSGFVPLPPAVHRALRGGHGHRLR